MDVKKYIYVDEDGARAIYDISHNRLKKMDEYLYVGDLIISYTRTNKVSIEASTDEHIYSVLDILEYNSNNPVLGCSHGCKYPCYAFMMAKRFGKVKNYEEWIKPKLVENCIDLLDKEIPKYYNKIESVQLCFSTDPFMMGYPEVKEMSLKIIKLLNDNKIKCRVLTKGILPTELGELSKENEYGISIVSLSD